MTDDWHKNEVYLARLRRAALHYRDAYDTVDRAILRGRWRKGAPLAFALERLTEEQLDKCGPEIAQAERARRAAKVALHATVESYALDAEALEGQEGREISKFISVVEGAWAGGCTYAGGGFVPRVLPPDVPYPEPALPPAPAPPDIEEPTEIMKSPVELSISSKLTISSKPVELSYESTSQEDTENTDLLSKVRVPAGTDPDATEDAATEDLSSQEAAKLRTPAQGDDDTLQVVPIVPIVP